MQNDRLYDRNMILTQVKKQLNFYEEDIAVGYKTKFDSKDIILAKNYVMDKYNYLINLN
jgi:hypothetical protein